jgi:glycosyltransferase involved in cell wall biosynthesis
MENLSVSIITPTFNSEKYIAQTIQSIQNQTYLNWELIIVDDCSCDKTVSIIADFARKDSRIKFFQLEKNSGTGVTRNYGLTKANGRFIAFLDSDDLWKPTKLEKQIDFLIKNKLPFTFTFYECIDERGNSLGKIVTAPRNLSYRRLFFCNYVGNLTAIYDVKYFGKIPISSIRKRQDWMLWLAILKKIKTAEALPESLAYYRIRENSISASKLTLLKHNFRVYRNFHNFNLMVALCCMIGFLFTQLFIKPLYIKKITSSI